MSGHGRDRTFPRIWLIAGLAIAILILGDLNRRMADARRLEQDTRLIQTEVAELEAESIRMQTELAGAANEATVEAWAHSQAKMIREGERLVVPVPGADVTPTPTPSSADPRAATSNWQVWLALIFGTSP